MLRVSHFVYPAIIPFVRAEIQRHNLLASRRYTLWTCKAVRVLRQRDLFCRGDHVRAYSQALRCCSRLRRTAEIFSEAPTDRGPECCSLPARASTMEEIRFLFGRYAKIRLQCGEMDGNARCQSMSAMTMPSNAGSDHYCDHHDQYGRVHAASMCDTPQARHSKV